MTISQLPNLITLSRLALVPVLIVLLNDRDYALAFVVFALAGVSDALDGYIAKRFQATTRLGAILDPVADKTLLVSAYVMLTVLEHLPFWLMVLVAFRDLLIVGGYLAYTSMYGPVQMRPSALSKSNTVAQTVLIAAIFMQLTISLLPEVLIELLMYVVAVTTIASGAHYLWVWIIKKDIDSAADSGETHD